MDKVLIANRGEIAVRIARACEDAGITSVAVYADVDADALHVSAATEAYVLTGSTPAQTYLDMQQILAIAERSGADAVHPGYGFLSENADFAQAVIDAGLVWIGPGPQSIRDLGNKVTAREIAAKVGAPLAAGSDGVVETPEEVHAFAQQHGLPIVIKAAFGGGGRGLRVVWNLNDIEEAFASATRESEVAFGRGECFVERFLERPRHIEAQILADRHGNVVVVGTRDCSVQRRNQKLIEEAPAPFLSTAQRAVIHSSAKAICREAGYEGAGTVEYLLAADGTISFLEVNTRLQVEHPVTEETSGVDLVLAQFAIAEGERLPFLADPEPIGHTFEFRINAEDVGRGFLPSPGIVGAFTVPTGPGIRVDSGVREGSVVPSQFDSLIAKLVVSGANRQQALRRSRRALREFQIEGVATVLPFHRAMMRESAFVREDGLDIYTTWIENEFSAEIPADPAFSVQEPDRLRQTLTIELDGRKVALGLPMELLTGIRIGASTVDLDVFEESVELRSTMAGSVVKWLVGPGDVVEKGSPVMMLEAMKMETSVYAHRCGMIGVLLVRVGDTVELNALLTTIDHMDESLNRR